MLAAGLAGLSAYWLSGAPVVFYLLGCHGGRRASSASSIPGAPSTTILPAGCTTPMRTTAGTALGSRVLLTCRPLLVFAVCVVLFHLSNAAMLPLVGQKARLQDKNMGTSLMSACIVAAQM